MTEPDPSSPAPIPAATTPASAPFEVRAHPGVLRLWYWQAIVVVALMSLPALLISGLAFGIYAMVAVVLVAVLLVRAWHRYQVRYVGRFRCRLLDDGLLLDRGVYWHSETFVPRERVQHTEVDQGPFARHFGIATLKVHTAGSKVGEIDIDGLAHDDAVALRDRLLDRQGRDAA